MTINGPEEKNILDTLNLLDSVVGSGNGAPASKEGILKNGEKNKEFISKKIKCLMAVSIPHAIFV